MQNAESPDVPPVRPAWNAFPTDGEWARPEDWRETVDAAVDPPRNVRALAALRSVFTPAWAQGDNGRHEKHALGVEHRWRANRFKLIELGRAIDDLRPGGRVRRSLREPSTFHTASTELCAGQLLLSSGATVQYEPGTGRGRRPDWLATWEGGATLAVEAKAPRMSDVDRVLHIAAASLFNKLNLGLNALPRGRECLHAELHLSEVIHEAMVRRVLERHAALPELGGRIGDAVVAHLAHFAPLDVGTYSLGRLGEIVVSLPVGTGGTPGIQPSGRCFGADDEHELLRLSAVTKDASAQLASIDAPGVVMIDTRDILLPSDARRALESILPSLGATGVRPPAAVLLRWTAAHAEAKVPYSGFHVLRGPNFDSIPAEFWSVFVRCPVGHHHFEPLKDPEEIHVCASADVEWL